MQKDISEAIAWLKGIARAGTRLRLDSREINPGDVFVALPGAHQDGRHFIPVAVARGASGVILETPSAPLPAAGVPMFMAKGLAQKIGEIAAHFYGNPSAALRGVAVTGTNGKTTTTHWIASLLTRLSLPCAVLGTVGAKLGEQRFEVPELTTPDAINLQALFATVRDAGASAFAIEASSVGLEQGRLNGAHFEVAVFTNLTRDHLDYHKTMQAYGQAKSLLFAWPTLKAAVVNLDDPAAALMAEVAHAHGVPLWGTTQRCAESARCRKLGELPIAHVLSAERIRLSREGIEFTLNIDGVLHSVHLPQVGDFNVSNAMQALATVLAMGFNAEAAVGLLSTLPSPPGRMQLLSAKASPLAVVDYSHTPDALEKALESLRVVAQARGGALWAVFGCGGDRDSGKRPIMGAIAARLADHVIVTSDNPRTEDPDAIIAQITASLSTLRTERDRAAAIKMAVLEAAPEDVILVAGKGHETYQIIGTVHHYFSDQEVVKAAFNERRTRASMGSEN